MGEVWGKRDGVVATRALGQALRARHGRALAAGEGGGEGVGEAWLGTRGPVWCVRRNACIRGRPGTGGGERKRAGRSFCSKLILLSHFATSTRDHGDLLDAQTVGTIQRTEVVIQNQDDVPCRFDVIAIGQDFAAVK